MLWLTVVNISISAYIYISMSTYWTIFLSDNSTRKDFTFSGISRWPSEKFLLPLPNTQVLNTYFSCLYTVPTPVPHTQFHETMHMVNSKHYNTVCLFSGTDDKKVKINSTLPWHPFSMLFIPQTVATKLKAHNCIQRLCMLRHYNYPSLELIDLKLSRKDNAPVHKVYSLQSFEWKS